MIEFPNLGLHFNIDPVALNVLGFSIYWYSLCIAAGFMLAVLLGIKGCKKIGLIPDNIIDLVLWGFPISIICARAYYVIFNWGAYKDNPISILNIRGGGLAIYGAIIGAFCVGYFFSKAKKVDTLTLFDFCVPLIALAQAIGRWGNFINQEAFGVNTNLPWGMTGDRIKASIIESGIPGLVPEQLVHPTFLYESLWNLFVFAFLILYSKKSKVKGEIFCLYMILYGIGRFFIEGLRIDSLMLGNLRISQVLAAVFVIAFSIVLVFMRKKAGEKALEKESIGVETGYGNVMNDMRSSETSHISVEDINEQK